MARRKAEVAPVTVVDETVGEQNGNTVTNNEEQAVKSNGTTAALFGQQPDFQPEPAQVETKPAVSEEKEEITEQPETSQPEEFYIEEILEKQGIPLEKIKSRIKVDGKEEVVSFEEFKKRVQLKEHLDRAGQELGRQRREFLEMRKGEEKRTPISQVPEKSDLAHESASSYSDPILAELKREIDELKAERAGLNPLIYDVNRQKVAKELKAEGFEDFLEYIPKMEVELSKVSDPALQAFYDTDEGAKVFFKGLWR